MTVIQIWLVLLLYNIPYYDMLGCAYSFDPLDVVTLQKMSFFVE